MYNPFGKPIEELTEGDLLAMLPGKTEGWMFEYKQAEKLSDTRGLAKSIASFANSHGGWLFVGIEADDTNEPVLDPIQGIPENEVQLTERIYQMSQSRLSPPPYLNVAAVGLDKGGAVLVVHVPESPNPPHIAMSEGKVYVRSGDTTETISDRRDLDRLYDKARANSEAVSELLAVHDSGRVFIDEVVEALPELSVNPRPQPIGAFSFVAYPTIRLPSLWDFTSQLPPATEMMTDIFNNSEEPARSWSRGLGRGGSRVKWHDHFRCQRMDDRLNLFYVDRFGHIGFATVAGETHQHPGGLNANVVRRCMENAVGFAAAAEFVYEQRGYMGQVGFIVRVSLPERGVRPPIEMGSSAVDLLDTVQHGEYAIRQDLERLVGLQDSPRTP